jgi:hypothetical protein
MASTLGLIGVID